MKVVFKNFSSHRRFGVELEFNKKVSQKELIDAIRRKDPKREIKRSETYEIDSNNSHWHVKFDRSCGERLKDGGWEISSFVASGFQDLKTICDVTDEVKKTGAETNKRCALHVHVETRDFKIQHMSRLASCWYSLEPLMMMSVPNYRRGSIYCRMFSEKWNNLRVLKDAEAVWNLIKPKNLHDKYLRNENRRHTMNFCNHCSGGDKMTVEFRFPEGTTSSEDVKHWCRLFLCFVEKAKTAKMEKVGEFFNLQQALYHLGLGGDDKKFYILSPALRETKLWFLNRLLEHCDNKKILEDTIKTKEKLTK